MSEREYEELLVALTVLQEAAREPWEGKLAVAWVISNRAKKQRKSPIDIVLAPYQFSCWNTDSPTRRMVAKALRNPVWADCVKAAKMALAREGVDPSRGAEFYLNEAVVLKMYGKLPKWFKRSKVTDKIGHHTFMVA